MDKITTDFGDVFLWTFWIFVFIGAITIWVLAIFDLFADHTIGGAAKVGWLALLILVPWVGVLIYWVVRDLSKRKLAKTMSTETL
jgi:Phospholipase_D-nuclease N-terminal